MKLIASLLIIVALSFGVHAEEKAKAKSWTINGKKIAAGMTRDQVVKMLGKPYAESDAEKFDGTQFTTLSYEDKGNLGTETRQEVGSAIGGLIPNPFGIGGSAIDRTSKKAAGGSIKHYSVEINSSGKVTRVTSSTR